MATSAKSKFPSFLNVLSLKNRVLQTSCLNKSRTRTELHFHDLYVTNHIYIVYLTIVQEKNIYMYIQMPKFYAYIIPSLLTASIVLY